MADQPPHPCTLMEGWFDYVMQLILGAVAMSALLVKRHYERPRRPVYVWVMDTSKQCIGALWAHALNIVLAARIASEARGSDQCVFYFINFTLDTSVGVAINWVLMLALQRVAVRCGWRALAESGAYGPAPPFLRTWSQQLFSWLGIVLLMKLIVGSFLFGFKHMLTDLGNSMFAPLQSNPKLELTLVMILCPCLMNMAQFWVQDNFLKKSAAAVGDGGLSGEDSGTDSVELDQKRDSMDEPLVSPEAPELHMELGLYESLRACHPLCLGCLRCPCPGKRCEEARIRVVYDSGVEKPPWFSTACSSSTNSDSCAEPQVAQPQPIRE